MFGLQETLNAAPESLPIFISPPTPKQVAADEKLLKLYGAVKDADQKFKWLATILASAYISRRPAFVLTKAAFAKLQEMETNHSLTLTNYSQGRQGTRNTVLAIANKFEHLYRIKVESSDVPPKYGKYMMPVFVVKNHELLDSMGLTYSDAVTFAIKNVTPHVQRVHSARWKNAGKKKGLDT